jgi:hypothetical protein
MDCWNDAAESCIISCAFVAAELVLNTELRRSRVGEFGEVDSPVGEGDNPVGVTVDVESIERPSGVVLVANVLGCQS